MVSVVDIIYYIFSRLLNWQLVFFYIYFSKAAQDFALATVLVHSSQLVLYASLVRFFDGAISRKSWLVIYDLAFLSSTLFVHQTSATQT